MRIVPFTGNREAIYGLLDRAKRFHSSISGVYEFDVTDLLAALAAKKRGTGNGERGAGNAPSLTAVLTKATSLVVERHPRLNHHLFHGFFRKYEVDFEDIACNLILMRKDEAGERILLPLVIERSNEKSIAEIHDAIEHHQHAPLAELPQIEAIRRIARAPRLALRWFSYKARSDHTFYRRYFGTYGLSSLVQRGGGGVSGHAIANTAAAFFPGTISDKPVVHHGEIRARTMLTIALVIDHFLIDAHEAIQAMRYLKRLVERPANLGLA